MPQGAKSLTVCRALDYVRLWGCAAVTCFYEEREPTTGMVLLPVMLWWVCLVVFSPTCTGLSMKMAALEVSPHALNLKLLHGKQCTNTVKALQEFCLRTKAIPQKEQKTDYPIEWRERKEKKKGVGGKDWELRITLATKIGICIVPRVLIVLENVKASWLETERNYRSQWSLESQQVQLSSIGRLSFSRSKMCHASSIFTTESGQYDSMTQPMLWLTITYKTRLKIEI